MGLLRPWLAVGALDDDERCPSLAAVALLGARVPVGDHLEVEGSGETRGTGGSRVSIPERFVSFVSSAAMSLRLLALPRLTIGSKDKSSPSCAAVGGGVSGAGAAAIADAEVGAEGAAATCSPFAAAEAASTATPEKAAAAAGAEARGAPELGASTSLGVRASGPRFPPRLRLLRFWPEGASPLVAVLAPAASGVLGWLPLCVVGLEAGAASPLAAAPFRNRRDDGVAFTGVAGAAMKNTTLPPTRTTANRPMKKDVVGDMRAGSSVSRKVGCSGRAQNDDPAKHSAANAADITSNSTAADSSRAAAASGSCIQTARVVLGCKSWDEEMTRTVT